MKTSCRWSTPSTVLRAVRKSGFNLNFRLGSILSDEFGGTELITLAGAHDGICTMLDTGGLARPGSLAVALCTWGVAPNRVLVVGLEMLEARWVLVRPWVTFVPTVGWNTSEAGVPMVKLAPRILEMVVNGACLKLPWPGATTETVELSGADESEPKVALPFPVYPAWAQCYKTFFCP